MPFIPAPRDERIRIFWSRIDRSDPEGCWPWIARSRHQFGYGKFYWNKRPQDSHRVAYEIENAPIPSDAHILHRCDNPPCCNPAHLFIGDQTANMADKAMKGRATQQRQRVITFGGQSLTIRKWAEKLGMSVTAMTRRFDTGWDTARALTQPAKPRRCWRDPSRPALEERTHCRRGHEYTVENTYQWIRPDGRTMRACRACRRIKQISHPPPQNRPQP